MGQCTGKKVICAAGCCPTRLNRVQRDDGTYGPCPRCGGALVRTLSTIDRRLARARADVARLDAAVGR